MQLPKIIGQTDISKQFNGPTYMSQFIGKGIIEREGTPEAIKFFAEHADKIDDYFYWFTLSTCWVSYSGHSDINLWKRLFASDRPKRKHSIMKPTEVRGYDALPNIVTVYRAHRPLEDDWIAYTLEEDIARRFAKERGVTSIKKYKVYKKYILALFLRRGEKEVIVLDKERITFVEEIKI